MNLTLKVWRQQNAKRSGQIRDPSGEGHHWGHVVPRNARRCSMKICLAAARIRSPLSMIAAKGSAAPADFWSTASRTAAARARPSASSRCVSSKTAIVLTLEPWRARAFPVIRDLIVDRSAFDRIIQSGGYISVPDRRRSRSQRDPGSQGCCRYRVRRGGLHRLRRLRRGLSQRIRNALHGGQTYASQCASPGPAAARSAHPEHGRCHAERSSSATAPIMANVRRFAPRRFPSSSSAR